MTQNNQPVEKRFMSERGCLDFHSMFFTLQGEGPYAGDRAIFIRLAGCNLQCPGCDTEYTSGRVMIMPDILVKRVQALCQEHEVQTTLIVITGGEPLRQNIAPLVFALLSEGHCIQIETNGVFDVPPELELYIRTQNVMLVVSPKTSRVHKRTAAMATVFKYVLRQGQINIEDGLPTVALGHKARPQVARPPLGWGGTVYVNPMDEQDNLLNKNNTDACTASALMHGHRMGIQLHKLLNLE